MTTNAFEDQPAQAIANEHVDSPPQYHIPEHKSSVTNRTNPNSASARYKKGDLVHRPTIANGVRTKVAYTVYESRHNPAGYVEYKLINVYTNKPEGVWIREKDLKVGG